MRLVASVMLSLTMVLTSGPVMAAFTCNNSAATAAVSGYQVAHANMDQGVQKHVQAVSNITEPVQGALRLVAGAFIPVVHGGEGITRATAGSIMALIAYAQQAGTCSMRNVSQLKLFGAVNCVIVAGGNAILVGAQTVNAGVQTAEFVVIKVSDEFFASIIGMSDAAADMFSDAGAKILSLPFVVISKVLKAGSYVVRTSVAFISDLAVDFVTMVGDVLCNFAKAFSELFKGRVKNFLKYMIAGTFGIVAQWVTDLVETLVVKPIKAVVKFFKDNANNQGTAKRYTSDR